VAEWSPKINFVVVINGRPKLDKLSQGVGPPVRFLTPMLFLFLALLFIFRGYSPNLSAFKCNFRGSRYKFVPYPLILSIKVQVRYKYLRNKQITSQNKRVVKSIIKALFKGLLGHLL